MNRSEFVNLIVDNIKNNMVRSFVEMFTEKPYLSIKKNLADTVVQTYDTLCENESSRKELQTYKTMLKFIIETTEKYKQDIKWEPSMDNYKFLDLIIKNYNEPGIKDFLNRFVGEPIPTEYAVDIKSLILHTLKQTPKDTIIQFQDELLGLIKQNNNKNGVDIVGTDIEIALIINKIKDNFGYSSVRNLVQNILNFKILKGWSDYIEHCLNKYLSNLLRSNFNSFNKTLTDIIDKEDKKKNKTSKNIEVVIESKELDVDSINACLNNVEEFINHNLTAGYLTKESTVEEILEFITNIKNRYVPVTVAINEYVNKVLLK